MLSTKIGVGESHAKLILLGEHAVVYGQPAIALPVSLLKMTVTLSASRYGQYIEDNEMRRRLELMDDDFEGIRQLILRLLDKFDSRQMPFSLEIDSNIPRGRGLGASAALATAVTKAFFDYFEAALSEKELLYFTNFSETIMHGRASGIDAATVNSEKPLWFVREGETEPLDIDLSAFLVIGDSGIRGLTTQAISVVQQKLKEFPEKVEAGIEKLGSLVYEARDTLLSGDIETLGNVFNASQAILKNLGVSHRKLDQLIEVALSRGALGAKLTGSGLGGVMIALAATERDAIRISQALSRNGAQNTWIFSLDPKNNL